ncbi:uncharacterized protein BKA78DRAFT_325397 [Phyllosticta capitalensis]|uniref:uncharacterized protein n=1 Tax=Phyllosticta capitalensis TaxID=121624 RepID=UPI0031328842
MFRSFHQAALNSTFLLLFTNTAKASNRDRYKVLVGPMAATKLYRRPGSMSANDEAAWLVVMCSQFNGSASG